MNSFGLELGRMKESVGNKPIKMLSCFRKEIISENSNNGNVSRFTLSGQMQTRERGILSLGKIFFLTFVFRLSFWGTFDI